ncbi:MAG TPA: translocation/assembly module TamB domain-containing protein [Thermoanaerobaculia bacterium]|nr:translocation/assembly module TamB domain-containing protein [Thermoanaerobaculia bacterium]
MRGCLRGLLWTALGFILFLLIISGGAYWYLGTASFSDLVKLRVEKTLEARLGRRVSVASVEIVTERESKVVVNDLRIGNVPGGVSPDFARVRQVVITGGVESFWRRKLKVGRIDIVDPQVFLEIYPEGAPVFNNVPYWRPEPQSRHEIVHLELGKMFVTGGLFGFLDQRHDIGIRAAGISSELKVSPSGGGYDGSARSPRVTVRIQDYTPFDVALRGNFRSSTNALAVNDVVLEGRDIRASVFGRFDPLYDGTYNLRINSQVGLNRVKEIFRVQQALTGVVTAVGHLRGKQGSFALEGDWSSPKVQADAYELEALRGKMNISGSRTIVDVQSARYGGGTITAHYVLAKHSEPYPMSADLRYDHVSLEKLFADWGIGESGLRGAATGTLVYRWNREKLMEGSGEGHATFAATNNIFSPALYPIPLAGSSDFALDRGVIAFRPSEVQTGSSNIAFNGTLRIEDLAADLGVQIDGGDLSVLDRAGYNFAHSLGKKSYTLLGLGGTGSISARVKGPLKAPSLVAHVSTDETKYNGVALGASEIDLRYDGAYSTLTFQPADFSDGNSTLALSGSIAFPDNESSPQFDLRVDAAGYSVDRATRAAGLKLVVSGLGSGKLAVTGSPDTGKVIFTGLAIHENNSDLHLDGAILWEPGKGNVRFDLAIGAQAVPVATIARFLDLGDVPAAGEVTGTLQLQGPKSKLNGAGAISVRRGTISGEPLDLVTTDLSFREGLLRLQSLKIAAPAGTIAGDGELDLESNHFNYKIQSSALDLSKITLLSSLNGVTGGTLTIKSSGSGTLDEPELVLDGTMTKTTFRGEELPADVPQPAVHLEVHRGHAVLRASAGDVLTIDGDADAIKDGAISGLVKIRVKDLAKLLAISPSASTLAASGHFEIDLKIGGKTTSLSDLRMDASVPELAIQMSDHEITAPETIGVSLRNGRVVIEHFALQRPGSKFSASGSVEITGEKRVDVNLQGSAEAALLQLVIPGLKADGRINLAARVYGTLDRPRLGGTAEIQDGQFKFTGFPQVIDRVSGTLLFKEDRIEINPLHAAVGGGTITAGGAILTDGLTPKRLQIALTGTEVALRYFEGLSLEGNFNLLLTGDVERAQLQGDIVVNHALYYKDFDFGTSLLNLILSRRGLAPAVVAGWQDKVGLRVHVKAPGTISVRINIAEVTASAELDMTGTLANPAVLGVVTIAEGGKVRFQNIDYRVVRGSINFQNPFRIDPYFDITVEGRVSGNYSELESGPIDITLNLTGTLDRITPTITSDPPASDITLFSLLGAGALTSRPGGTTAPDTGVAGRSLLYQSVISAVGSKFLPFADSFTYDPGMLDTSSTPGPKVTFEKRVSGSVRVVVVYNLRDQKNRELVEWQVNPEWTLQFTRDEPRNEYVLEARFRRRYEGRWTLRGEAGPGVQILPVTYPLRSEAVQEAITPETTATSSPEPPGPRADRRAVRRIAFRTDTQFDTRALSQFIALKIGQPLTLRAVQSSIKSLYATGNFRDIQVESANDEPDGVAVTFHLLLNHRIGEIKFEGVRGGDRDRADHALTIHIGDVLSLNAVDHSAVAAKDALLRRGYLEVVVDPETRFSRQSNRADVIFHVTLGSLAKVRDVELEGDLAPFAPKELTDAMACKPGRVFRLDDAREDAHRIRNVLFHHEYRKADVRYVDYTYDQATTSVKLHYRITVGPIVKVILDGSSARFVRKLIPFRRNQAYSVDAVERAADDIVTSYQQRGYFNATVDVEESSSEGNPKTWTTTFHVVPGSHFSLEAVTFTGRAKVPERELRDVITTAPAGGFRAFLGSLVGIHNGVTRKALNDDRDAIESYCRLHGFSEIKAGEPVTLAFANGHLRVDFPIVEGPQTLVSTLRIEGNEQVPSSKLPQVQLRKGQPLNPQLMREDQAALQSFYADRGNAEARITTHVEPTPDRTGAAVTYTIAEGPKIKIEEIVIRGNSYTSSKVVLRKAGLALGDPFSYPSLLDAQRNLYRLGIFQRVDVHPEPAGASPFGRNVVMQVEEGKDLTVSASIGMSSGIQSAQNRLTPRGAFSISHRNLFGTGRYLGLEAIEGTNDRQAYLTYREPYIGRYNVPIQLTIFQSNDATRRETTIRQRGVFVEAAKVLQYRTRWSLRYEYRLSDCIKGDVCTAAAGGTPIPGVDKSLQNIKISSVTPTFFWDHRDDAINPHRGFFTSASIEYAFPLFDARTNFAKEFVQGSWYLPASPRSTLAFSVRAGLIEPFGAAGTLSSTVPLSERFTAGGENSQRAYALDLLGTLCDRPEDIGKGCQPTLSRTSDGTVVPLGGNGLLLLNVEYRFPIFSSFGGGLFFDAGNVYHDSTIHFEDLRYGIGTGVRYLSPVGPIRFDVGYKLNRKPGEKPYAYFITLGYAF